MGSRASIMLQDEEIQEIQKETGFSHKQIVRLYSRFTSLDKGGNGVLSREDFLRIPELAINPLGDRIVHAFFMEGFDGMPDEFSNSDGVNFRQFMKTLARFRPLKIKEGDENKEVVNSRAEKLRFAFRMYDLDGDDQISRVELLAVLHMMVGANISEQQLGSIADRTIAEADKDLDGQISFSEFSKVMERVEVEGKMCIRFLN